MSFQQHLFDHVYPPLLLRHPLLIEPLYIWNNLFLQRNWLARSVLKFYLKKLPPDSLVVDAGCGDGQHIFFFCRKSPQLHFFGVDKNEGNILFCQKKSAGQTYPPKRLQFARQDLEALSLREKASLIYCIGTLQYIADDLLVLKNFYQALRPDGQLLLYLPVNGRTILPPYRCFFSKLEHYEKKQQRRRIYTPPIIFEKMALAGFEIKEWRYTYGPIGIVGHEIYSLLLMAAGNLGGWVWLLFPFALALLPLVFLLKLADYFLPKKKGNGLLVVGEKKV